VFLPPLLDKNGNFLPLLLVLGSILDKKDDFLPLLLDFSLLRFGYEADVKEIIIKNNSIFCEFRKLLLSLHPK
jgi:hypothetical protein